MGIRRNKTMIEQAADYVEAAVETAREKAGPAIADAIDKAGPVLTDAKDKAGPVLTDAKDKAAPLLAAGIAAAAAQASNVADLASEKAGELQDKITGEPKKKHTFRKILVITGIAALLGFVAKKLASRGQQDNWQSSYTPPPPPGQQASDTPIFDAAAAASDDEIAPDDEGGAGPDEALADAAEAPHAVTTPDEPADVVEVESEKPSAKS
jgi:vacuolar-type H+-ATPase subunit H